MALSPPTKRRLIITAGILLAAVAPQLLLDFSGADSGMGLDTDDPFTYAGSAARAGGFLLFLGYAFTIYAAFQVSTVWGVVALVVPFAPLVFLFLYWQRCRDALLFIGLGSLLFLVRAIVHQ